jgi:hypothetical protein
MEREIKAMPIYTKIIYKKPSVLLEDIPDRKILLINIENIIDTIIKKHIDGSYASSQLNEGNISINFPQIYNKLCILSNKNQKEFLAVYSEIKNLVINKIENLLTDIKFTEVKQEFEQELKKLMDNYTLCETLAEFIKNITINNNTRFQSSLVMNIAAINTKNIFSRFLEKHTQNFSQSLKVYINSSIDIYSDNFIFTVLNFLQAIGAKTLYNEILENEREKIITFHKTEFSSLLDKQENNLAEFLTEYNTIVKNKIFNFKLLFGEHNSGSLQEKLMEVVFLNNLFQILNNKNIMDSVWSKKNLHVLNLIYNLMNKKIDSLNSFQNKFFEFFTGKFFSEAKIPKNFKEGLSYIEFLLEKITTLNEIYVKCFNRDRRIHLRYKETISRLTLNKNVKNIAMLCGVFINEVMSRNVGSYSTIQEILNNFSTILQSIEDRDNFFLYIHKLMIKRISNMKFVIENEIFLIKILSENFGNRHCFPLFRILQDLENSEAHFNTVKGYIKNSENALFDLIKRGNFNLFSFNAINQNDLTEIIQNSSTQNSLMMINSLITDKYVEQYPHRKVTISQNLSTCILFMIDSKVEIFVNFIQAYILLKLNAVNKFMKLEELISKNNLNVKGSALTHFRSNMISLINCGLVLVNNKNKENITNVSNFELINSDVLSINLSYSPGKNFINLTNIGEISYATTPKKDELSLTRDHTSQSDIHALEASIESRSSNFLANKSFIIDCIIAKVLKKFKEIEHNQLMKILLDELKLNFSSSNIPDISFFKARIDILIERSLLTRNIENNKIIYKYS